jgi:hypothetical protein
MRLAKLLAAKRARLAKKERGCGKIFSLEDCKERMRQAKLLASKRVTMVKKK